MNTTSTMADLFLACSFLLGSVASSNSQDLTHPQTNGPAEVNAEDASPLLVVSDWGRMLRGLQCRANLPTQIELGMKLDVAVDFRVAAEKLPDSVKVLNPCFDRCTPFKLHCKNVDTGARFEVEANHRTIGPTPSEDNGQRAIPLDGTAIKPRRATFTLRRAEPEPGPGPHLCFVRFAQPEGPTTNWCGTSDEWDALGAWVGTIRSHPATVELLPPTPKTRTILVPKRLRIVKQTARLSLETPEEAFLVTTYHNEDAEEITVPVRNGHWIGYRVEGGYGVSERGGVPAPEDSLDQWHRYKDGDRNVTYKITIFETCASGPWITSCGYKIQWEKTFDLHFTEAELLAVLDK